MADILGTGAYTQAPGSGYWAAGENPWDPAQFIDTSTVKYNITKLPGLDFGTIAPYSSFGSGQIDPTLVNYMNQKYGYNLYDYMARTAAQGGTPLLGSYSSVPVGGAAPQTTYQLYAGQVDPFMQALGVSNDPMAQQYFSALGGNLTQAETLERQRQDAQEKAATQEWATLAALGIGAPLALGAAGLIPMVPTGAAAEALGTTAALSSTGGNMGFFDSLLGDASWGVNPADTFYPIEGTIPGIDPASWGSYASGGADIIGAMAADPIELGWQAMQQTGAASFTDAAQALGFPSFEAYAGSINPAWVAGGSSVLGSLKNVGSSLLKGLFGGQNDSLNSLFGTGGNILGNVISAAPILGGLAYAANQTGFDTSRLENLYNQYNPQAATLEYDLNTAAGRNRLTSNLARRNVLGSSFGNFDLSSYNTLRDLGRQQLINQAVTPAAGIAGQILNANVAERALKNELYGRGLSALGMALSPKAVGVLQ